MVDKKKISVTIDLDIEQRLQQLTEISGKTLSHFVNHLLKRETKRLNQLLVKYQKIKDQFGGEE